MEEDITNIQSVYPINDGSQFYTISAPTLKKLIQLVNMKEIKRESAVVWTKDAQGQFVLIYYK